MSILNKLKAVLFLFAMCPQKLLHILKSYTPHTLTETMWLNELLPIFIIHTHTHTSKNICIYLIGFIFYSLFAHIYSFFSCFLSLARSFVRSLTLSFAFLFTFLPLHTHNEWIHTHINLYFFFAICFYFVVSCFLFHKLAVMCSHEWLCNA